VFYYFSYVLQKYVRFYGLHEYFKMKTDDGMSVVITASPCTQV